MPVITRNYWAVIFYVGIGMTARSLLHKKNFVLSLELARNPCERTKIYFVNSFTTIRVLAGTKKLAQNTTINTMVSFRRLQRRGFYS